MKIDHQLAERWIKPNAKVLDLGCGNGDLLAHLQNKLGVFGYGIEIDQTKINDCITKGVNVIEQDLNDGLARFADASFDTVVMARALQAVKEPDQLLLDMVRVGKEVIVTFPNFAHWQNRIHLGIKGMMPMSEALPFAWYNTPNIHLCTFKDFESCVMTMTFVSSIVLRYKKVKSPTLCYLHKLSVKTPTYLPMWQSIVLPKNKLFYR